MCKNRYENIANFSKKDFFSPFFYMVGKRKKNCAKALWNLNARPFLHRCVSLWNGTTFKRVDLLQLISYKMLWKIGKYEKF